MTSYYSGLVETFSFVSLSLRELGSRERFSCWFPVYRHKALPLALFSVWELKHSHLNFFPRSERCPDHASILSPDDLVQ